MSELMAVLGLYIAACDLEPKHGYPVVTLEYTIQTPAQQHLELAEKSVTQAKRERQCEIETEKLLQKFRQLQGGEERRK